MVASADLDDVEVLQGQEALTPYQFSTRVSETLFLQPLRHVYVSSTPLLLHQNGVNIACITQTWITEPNAGCLSFEHRCM